MAARSTNTDNFRVSVVVPVYNAATRVRRAVESALSLPEVAEVILVEDGSPDNALAVCVELAASERVSLVRHPDGGNHGAGASRNLGARHAKSDFIAFLDADDWYLPNRFKCEKELMLDPAVDGVYGAIDHYFESETLRAQWLAQERPEITTVSHYVRPEELIDVLMWCHPTVKGDFSTIALTVRRDFFWRVGGFYEPLRLQQDTHLWKRMAALGRLEAGSISVPVATACIHAENRMTNLADQARYRELWWSSLYDAFKSGGAPHRVLQIWRKGYSTFRSGRAPRWKALASLGTWTVRNPREIAIPYGHFDLTFRNIFNSHSAALRILSIKNRMLSGQQG